MPQFEDHRHQAAVPLLSLPCATSTVQAKKDMMCVTPVVSRTTMAIVTISIPLLSQLMKLANICSAAR